MIGKTQFLAVLGILVLCGSAWAVEVNEPVAHWKFDETSGTTALDCVGDNNGTVHGAIWTAGQVGGALSFDGVDDYVEVSDSDSLDLVSSFTISLWLKSTETGNKVILEKADAWDTDMRYFIISNAEGFKIFYGVDITDVHGTNANVLDNEWHLLTFVFDGSTGSLYVDGNLDVYESGWSMGSATTKNIGIGGRVTGAFSIDGSIDDVRIYDRALSAEEIWQLYVDGFSSYERAIIRVENAIDKKEKMLEGIGETLKKEDGAYDALEELLESGDYGDLKKGDIVIAKQKIHSATQHEEQSIDALEKSIEKLYDALAALGWEPEPNLIAHWKFDEGSGTTAYDSVGNNDGTLVNGPVWTTGQVDGALSFDGVDDYVDLSSTMQFDNRDFAITGWFRTDSNTIGTHEQIWNSGYDGDGEDLEVAMKNNKLFFYARQVGNAYMRQSAGTANDGTWHHFAALRNGNDFHLYLDGVLSSSASKTLGDLDAAGVIPRIGNGLNAIDYRFFNGSIDDVRIYDRALSAEEIQELYLEGLSGSGKGKGK